MACSWRVPEGPRCKPDGDDKADGMKLQAGWGEIMYDIYWDSPACCIVRWIPYLYMYCMAGWEKMWLVTSYNKSSNLRKELCVSIPCDCFVDCVTVLLTVWYMWRDGLYLLSKQLVSEGVQMSKRYIKYVMVVWRCIVKVQRCSFEPLGVYLSSCGWVDCVAH